jgi:hypothetical protein
MRLRVVDRKKNEMIDIKVEVDKYTFIVALDIINEKFNYLRKPLFDIRQKHLKVYLDNTELAKEVEHQIFNEIFDVLTEEIKTIYEREGIMYYTM